MSLQLKPDQQWLFTESDGLDRTLRLEAMGCDPVPAEIYDKLE